MAETLRGGKWFWADIMLDLARQGGLDGIFVDPRSMVIHPCCGGQTKAGTLFYITWKYNEWLLISMNSEEVALIEAFTKVLEYRPFCRYLEASGLITFEWDKGDPDGRFAELQKKGKAELRRL